MAEDAASNDLLTLTADIVAAHVANNMVATGDVPALIQSIYGALSSLGAPAEVAVPEKPTAAVSIRKSLASGSHIVSMIDGKPYKMLKRHIGQHGHTPASYREAYGLPIDYPMVAPDYGQQRRDLAHKIGLGRKPKIAATPAPKPRGRKPKVAAAST